MESSVWLDLFINSDCVFSCHVNSPCIRLASCIAQMASGPSDGRVGPGSDMIATAG